VELDLPVKSIDDLERLLRDMGYSHSAATEILKWYRDGSSNRVP
jgi:hypothetical protein